MKTTRYEIRYRVKSPESPYYGAWRVAPRTFSTATRACMAADKLRMLRDGGQWKVYKATTTRELVRSSNAE